MSWVRSRLKEVRRLKRQAGGDAFTITLEDGTRKSFSRAQFFQNFMRNSMRLRALYKGEDVPPPHELGQALTQAENVPPELERIARDQRKLDRQVEGG